MAEQDERVKRLAPGDVRSQEIVKAFEGVEFPASRDDLVDRARQNEAPAEVVDAIRNLPERRYEGTVDVERAFGKRD